MDAYTSFAAVYDTFMDNIPYEEWTEYLIGLLKEYGICDGLIADLGCGTGNMTEQLAEAGVLPELIRFSCGIEDSEDLIADIDQALASI